MPDINPAAAVADTSLPLSRIVVLDLTLARAGPTCVRHLADWGAQVIRIEPPSKGGEDITGNRDGFDFQNLHRNKQCISLNLKSTGGARGLHAPRGDGGRGDREHACRGEAPAACRV